MPVLFAAAALSVVLALVSPLIFFVINALRDEGAEGL
jgi:hypothetical protein